MSYSRDHTIDILRSIAIITMIAANVAPYSFEEPHPFWLRVFGSFAAPLFITLSGTLVHIGLLKKNKTFFYILTRAGLIILVAALIDIFLWRIIPFTTVDVLYLIGISTPVIYLLRNITVTQRTLLVLILFMTAPILQSQLGYTDYPTEYSLTGELATDTKNQTSILNHWLVDGWFPIVPWLGFAILGSIIAEIQQGVYSIKIKSPVFLVLGIVLLVFGLLYWFANPVILFTRSGYSELFYPPTIGYCFCATGLIFILFYLITLSKVVQNIKALRFFGECSLLMYILHLVFINGLVEPFLTPGNLNQFLLIYLALTLTLLLIAAPVAYFKKKVKNIPYLLKFLIGS